MDERVQTGGARRSMLALSFGWMAVLPRLIRLQSLSSTTGGLGSSGKPEGLVPVFCPWDDRPAPVWVHRKAVGSVYCNDRTHWELPMEAIDPRTPLDEIPRYIENHRRRLTE